MEMMIHAPLKKKKKKMQLQHMITKLPREPVLPGLSSDFQELTVTHSGPTSRCCCNCKHQFNQWLCNFITVSSSAVIISNFCSPCCRFTANICCTVAGRQQVLDHYSCVRSATGGRVGGERERERENSRCELVHLYCMFHQSVCKQQVKPVAWFLSEGRLLWCDWSV